MVPRDREEEEIAKEITREEKNKEEPPKEKLQEESPREEAHREEKDIEIKDLALLLARAGGRQMKVPRAAFLLAHSLGADSEAGRLLYRAMKKGTIREGAWRLIRNWMEERGRNGRR